MVRSPVFAGTFYPADPAALRDCVEGFLASPPGRDPDAPTPRALVAPHAGYVYSGPVAGSAYRILSRCAAPPARVLLLGPSHRHAFEGLAVPIESAFATPLGTIEVDARLREVVGGSARPVPEAHAREHSLEVQLPFLQVVLPTFSVLPVVVGRTDGREVAELVSACLAADPEILVVASSDLSHYLSYEEAVATDRETASRMVALDADLDPDAACGVRCLAGLLQVASAQGWTLETLDLRNSGDTSGDRRRVVGYGAFAAWGTR